MYFAEKDGKRCRIPERKKSAYENMGYKCTKICPKGNEVAKAHNEPKKADKTE